MKRTLVIALFLALAAPVFLLGCGKDNPVKVYDDDWHLPIYPDQSTPKNTVLRMVAALANRDSVMTDSVYADDYEGTSTDLTDQGSSPLEFVKADEVGFVGALARSSNLVRLEVDLGPSETWGQYHYASDPAGWITIPIPSFQMMVTDTYGEYAVRSFGSGETWIFEFTLRPTPNDASPTDTTWAIVRWVESRAHN